MSKKLVSDSREKVKENLVNTRQFCRFKKAVLVAVSAVLSFVTACDGKPHISPSSSDLVGRVVKVSDGDTITILETPVGAAPRADRPVQHKIRLQGIDAPEKSQAYGDAAQRYLAGLVAGQEVRVAWNKRDKYNRILGTVYIKRAEVNLAMLRAGYAWHYKKFDSTPAYAQAESEARAARRGLWAGLDPIPPEQFRHGRARTSAAPPGGARRLAEPLGGASPPGEPHARTEYRAGRTLPVAARTPAPVNATWPETGYWLSTNSNKRHNRHCENYRKTRGYPCQKNEGDRCGKCGG